MATEPSVTRGRSGVRNPAPLPSEEHLHGGAESQADELWASQKMGISQNGGFPKWLDGLFQGKSQAKMDDGWGYPLF